MEYILQQEESVAFKLRRIYEAMGYKKYKMSKFEEYDLYAENKDFLKGAGILTFTDARGKLMALKPDVTMSIIKSAPKDSNTCEKVYYNENIYRLDAGGRYKEISQTGLECIGKIDGYSQYEVLLLAAKSLSEFSNDYIIDISHMGILGKILCEAKIPSYERDKILECIFKKSLHEIEDIKPIIGDEVYDKIAKLIRFNPDPNSGLDELKYICGECDALDELKAVCNGLASEIGSEHIKLNSAVIQDVSYYNGIIFQGFISGIPEKVLSGGQYDYLAARMGKSCQAIGFGINTELLIKPKKHDIKNQKVLLIYSNGESILDIEAAAKKLAESGRQVEIQPDMPKACDYAEVFKITNGAVTKIG